MKATIRLYWVAVGMALIYLATAVGHGYAWLCETYPRLVTYPVGDSFWINPSPLCAAIAFQWILTVHGAVAVVVKGWLGK